MATACGAIGQSTRNLDSIKYLDPQRQQPAASASALPVRPQFSLLYVTVQTCMFARSPAYLRYSNYERIQRHDALSS